MTATASRQPAMSREFEAKAKDLIAVTRNCSIQQILYVRRLSLHDPETLKWASENHLKVIFNVVMNAKLLALGAEPLHEAQESDFNTLLRPAGADYPDEQRAEDHLILTHAVTQALATILHQSTATAPEPRAPAPAPPTPAAGPAPAPRTVPARPAAPPSAPEPSPKPVPTRPTRSSGPVTFESVFDETLCAYVRRPLATLQVTDSNGKSADGMPYLLAPAFADALDVALRSHVLPAMRKTRFIRTMSENYQWEEAGSKTVESIIQAGEANNPILHTWDSRWAELKVDPGKAGAAAAAEPKKKGGFFGGSSKDSTKSPAQLKAKAEADEMWAMFKAAAEKHRFAKPRSSDIGLFQAMIRYNPALFAKAWNELKDLYNQEFNPSRLQEQGREGSFRDGLNKWADKLPTSIGEFMTMKSYYAFDKVDLDFLQKFSRSHGKTPAERKRAIPHLMQFINHLGGEE